MALMAAHRKSFIRRSIPSLREEISTRRVRIRRQEEDIETLKTQRDKIQELIDFTSMLGDIVDILYSNIDYYHGDNRDRSDERAGAIRDAINDQKAAHQRNINIINTSITSLDGRISSLENSNNIANNAITNMLSEWRNGNAGMSFPNSSVI